MHHQPAVKVWWLPSMPSPLDDPARVQPVTLKDATLNQILKCQCTS